MARGIRNSTIGSDDGTFCGMGRPTRALSRMQPYGGI